MKQLKIFCIIVWSLVLLMLSYISFSITTVQSQTETVSIKMEKVEPQKNEITLISNDIISESVKDYKEIVAKDIAEAVMKASKKHDIPAYIIYAIIATESNKYHMNEFSSDNILDVNRNARSSYNCIGLMQVSPKWVLPEYNKFYKTNYTEKDLYNININIDIGTWHYKQFRNITKNWVELYVIYNVGYNEYNRVNNYWYFDYNGKWNCDKRNKFFYMNDLIPPTKQTNYKKGMYGKNKLGDYNAKKRFEKALAICREELDY